LIPLSFLREKIKKGKTKADLVKKMSGCILDETQHIGKFRK
jgi:hypothetical protein